MKCKYCKDMGRDGPCMLCDLNEINKAVEALKDSNQNGTVSWDKLKKEIIPKQQQKLEDEILTRIVIDKLTPSDLAQLAARHGLVLLPETPTPEMETAMLNNFHYGDCGCSDIEDWYGPFIEAGKIK